MNSKNIRSKYFRFMIPMFILLLIGEYAYPGLSTDQFNKLMPWFIETAGWTPNALSAPLTVGRAVGIPLTFVCGLLIAKFGAKKMFAISILSYGLAELLVTFSGPYWMYYAGMCILNITGTWILMATFSLCNHWFRKWRGTALGIVTMISPISSATLIKYMDFGVDNMGFQWTFGLMAIVMLIAALFSFIVVRETPEEVGCFPDAALIAPPPEVLVHDDKVNKIGPKQIFRHKEAYLHPLVMGLMIFAIPCYSGFFTTRFAELGYTPAEMTVFIFGYSIFGAVLSFISGVLDDKMGTHRTLILMTAIFFVGSIGLRFGTPDQPGWMWFGIISLGGIVGAVPNLNPSHCVYTYGRKCFDQVYKYINALVSVPACFAMTFVTSLYQGTGSYDLAYTIMIPISLGILICAILMNKRYDLTADIKD